MYNVIAVRLPESARIDAAAPAAAASSAGPFPALSLLTAKSTVQPVELNELKPVESKLEDGSTVLVKERRSLQMVEPRMPAELGARGSDQLTSLCIWNTHLEVGDEEIRWQSAMRMGRELDFQAQKQQPAAAVSALRSSTSPRVSSRRSGAVVATSSSSSSSTHCTKTRNHILVGDLNALARLDYSPSEVYFHSRIEHFLHAGRTDSWRVMDLLEEEERWVDLFTQAQTPRPKISAWSCRRVDHALAYSGCQWTAMFASPIFTLASDHLPQFFILQPTLS